MFNMLRLEEEQVTWLTLPQKVWEEDPGYRRKQEFISHLEVVNDSEERGVKLIQVNFTLTLILNLPLNSLSLNSLKGYKKKNGKLSTFCG